MQATIPNKLNEAQMNLIKSFMFLHNESEIKEIDSLVNFYLERKLDEAIEKAESGRNYTASVYEDWLATGAQSNNK